MKVLSAGPAVTVLGSYGRRARLSTPPPVFFAIPHGAH